MSLDTKAYQSIFEEWVTDLYSRDTNHLQFTPVSLAEEICDKVTDWSGDICVMYCVSLFRSVFKRVSNLYGREYAQEHITFIASNEEKIQFCEQISGGKIQSVNVQWNKLNAWLKEKQKMKFDVIVGNPPYQGITEGNTKGTTHTPKLWGKFISLSINELSKNGGVVALVTPPGWLVGESRANKAIFDLNVIHVCSGIDGQKVFGASTNAAFFVLQNTPRSKTHFTFKFFENENEISLNDGSLIPISASHSSMLSISIIEKTLTSTEKLPVVKPTQKIETRSVQDEEFKFPTYVERKKVLFSNTKLSFFDTPKIVIWRILKRYGKILSIRPTYDIGHNIINNFGGGHTFIEISDRYSEECLMAYLSSKLVKYLINLFVQTAHTPNHIVSKLPAIPNKVMTDNELYDLFKLTAEEIKHIEEVVG